MMPVRVIVASALVGSLFLAGCGGSNNLHSASTSSAATDPKAGQVPHVGVTFDLAGESPGEMVAVTLVKVDPTTEAFSDFTNPPTADAPPAGDRFYAAEYRLHNIGSVTYTDSVANGTTAFDKAGHGYHADFADSISDGPQIDQVNITPGSTVLGWIIYDVPTAVTITAVQYIVKVNYGVGGWYVP